MKEQLTKREKDVLRLIIQGCSNKEICEKLFITRSTLSVHIVNLYQKHGLSQEYRNGSATMRLRLALNYLKPTGEVL